MCAAISSLGEELKIGPNQEISIGSKIFAVRETRTDRAGNNTRFFFFA